MNASLNRLRDLPPDTAMYCGHEYTAANLQIRLDGGARQSRRARLSGTASRALRAADAPTLPSRMALERQVNPFLRCDEPAVRAAAEAPCRHGALDEPAEVFAVLRAWKDQFR